MEWPRCQISLSHELSVPMLYFISLNESRVETKNHTNWLNLL